VDNEWYTPAKYIDLVRKVLGTIDLDPASNATAQKVVRATTYYDKDSDGLARKWAGRVFMNPPYSRGLVDKFTSKLYEDYASGDVTEAIVLLNNTTATQWFFDDMTQMATAICFPTRRIQFEGRKKGSPPSGQMFVYIGHEEELFCKTFMGLGQCWIPVLDDGPWPPSAMATVELLPDG
jgi:hypothetical protein